MEASFILGAAPKLSSAYDEPAPPTLPATVKHTTAKTTGAESRTRQGPQTILFDIKGETIPGNCSIARCAPFRSNPDPSWPRTMPAREACGKYDCSCSRWTSSGERFAKEMTPGRTRGCYRDNATKTNGKSSEEHTTSEAHVQRGSSTTHINL